MISRQSRQASASQNNHLFRFSNSNQNLSDEVAFRRWADLIKTSHSGSRFGRSVDPRVGPWIARSSPRRYDDDDDDDPHVLSPPLWERKSNEEEERGEGKKCRPSSRKQVIGKYRQEMMDLVKDAPENTYELSLKDIVEVSRPVGLQSPTIEEKITEGKNKKGRKKRANKVWRSGGLNAGVFLFKMFLLPTFGRRQSLGSGGADGGTPAKPLKPANRKESSDCSGSSSNTRRKISGCFPTFGANRNKVLDF